MFEELEVLVEEVGIVIGVDGFVRVLLARGVEINLFEGVFGSEELGDGTLEAGRDGAGEMSYPD